MGRTAGRNGSIDNIWVEYAHMRGSRAGIRPAVVDPGSTRRSQILVNSFELDIAHEVRGIGCRLVVVQPTEKLEVSTYT